MTSNHIISTDPKQSSTNRDAGPTPTPSSSTSTSTLEPTPSSLENPQPNSETTAIAENSFPIAVFQSTLSKIDESLETTNNPTDDMIPNKNIQPNSINEASLIEDVDATDGMNSSEALHPSSNLEDDQDHEDDEDENDIENDHDIGVEGDERNHKGRSCHQCKNTKSLGKLAFCANLFNKRTKPEKRVCRKKYCETCLKKFYNDSLAEIQAQRHWICASCRGVCICAACARSVAKKRKARERRNIDTAQVVQGGVSFPPASSLNAPSTWPAIPFINPMNPSLNAQLSFEQLNLYQMHYQQQVQQQLLLQKQLQLHQQQQQQQQLQQPQQLSSESQLQAHLILSQLQYQDQLLQQQQLMASQHNSLLNFPRSSAAIGQHNPIQNSMYPHSGASSNSNLTSSLFPPTAGLASLSNLPLTPPMTSTTLPNLSLPPQAPTTSGSSLPVPCSSPSENMRLLSLDMNRSPIGSPIAHHSDSPFLRPRNVAPVVVVQGGNGAGSNSNLTPLSSTGKLPSPSLTKRAAINSRDWPYANDRFKTFSGSYSDVESPLIEAATLTSTPKTNTGSSSSRSRHLSSSHSESPSPYLPPHSRLAQIARAKSHEEVELPTPITPPITLGKLGSTSGSAFTRPSDSRVAGAFTQLKRITAQDM